MNPEDWALLDHVRDVLRKEEDGLAVFARHLSALMVRSGLPPAEVAGIRQTLSGILETNRSNVARLHELLDRLRGEAPP